MPRVMGVFPALLIRGRRVQRVAPVGWRPLLPSRCSRLEPFSGELLNGVFMTFIYLVSIDYEVEVGESKYIPISQLRWFDVLDPRKDLAVQSEGSTVTQSKQENTNGEHKDSLGSSHLEPMEGLHPGE